MQTFPYISRGMYGVEHCCEETVSQIASVYAVGGDDTAILAGGVWSNNSPEDSSPELS